MTRAPDDRGSLWDLDTKVRERIASDNPDVARLCESGLRLLASGIALMEGPEMKPHEMVTAMAMAQVSNSIRSAVNLAFGGYPVQSLALTRLAAEYWLLVAYMQIRPDEAPGWQDFSAKPPMTAGELAQVVFADDSAASDVFRELRQVLHRFAHQDNLGLAAIYKEAHGTTAVLQLGSDPDPHLLVAVAYPLFLVMALALDSLSRLYASPSAACANGVASFLPLVVRWQDRVAVEEEERLRAMGLM
jgi:hypothetical protein